MKLGFIVCKSAAPLVRKLDAGNLPVQFDERDLETETWSDNQTPTTERVGQHVMTVPNSTAPDLDSTTFGYSSVGT